MHLLKDLKRRFTSQHSRVVMRVQEGDLFLYVLDCPFIEKENVDVIVNVVSPTLNLNGRKLSSAISLAAGPGMQRTLTTAALERPHAGDVLATPGFNLKCKTVYHVVASGYNSGGGDALMEESVLRCLKMAHADGHRSIAIPAIGVGGMGLLPDNVAKHMLHAVTRFEQGLQAGSCVREIRFALMETSVRVAFIRRLTKPLPESEIFIKFDETAAPQHDPSGQLCHMTDSIKQNNIVRFYPYWTDTFIPWRWTGMMGRPPGRKESEWIDFLIDDLFIHNPRSPILLHGAAGIGKTRFLSQVQELFVRNSLTWFTCILHVSAFGVLKNETLVDIVWSHIRDLGIPSVDARRMFSYHGPEVLVLVDDAELLKEEHITQLFKDSLLSQLSFVFAVRTHDAHRLSRCLCASDVIELQGFTVVEVERYIRLQLKGSGSDLDSLVTALTTEENMLLSRIPGNLKHMCRLWEDGCDVDVEGRLAVLMMTIMKHTPRLQNDSHNPAESWLAYLEQDKERLGEAFYLYFTQGKTLDNLDLAAILGTSNAFSVKHIIDFAVAKHICNIARDDQALAGCISLSSAYSLKTPLQVACGLSNVAANSIQTTILWLAHEDEDVQLARANVLDLADDDSALTLNLLADLEEGCRREVKGNFLKDIPVELQHLGPEYMLAYQRHKAEGSQRVFQTRVMFVGHFEAGKTSLKGLLTKEPFSTEYSITNGIDLDPAACKIFIDNTSNWKLLNKDIENEGQEFVTVMAKLLHRLLRRLRPAQIKSPAPLKEIAEMLLEAEEENTQRLGPEGPNIDRLPTNPPQSPEATERPVSEGTSADTGYSSNVLPASFQSLIEADIPEDILRQLYNLLKREDEENNVNGSNDHSEIRLSFWDFAGQTVFYTTHQTFLTHRAIYLLVLDLTKPLNCPIETYRQGRHGKVLDKACPQTVADYLDYWLSCIHTHVASRYLFPNCNTLTPPVIIVGTHRDVIEEQYPDTAKQRIDDYFASIHKYIERKAYFEHVHFRFFAVSNREPDDLEADELRQTIVDVARDQVYWGEWIPIRWIALRDRLKRARREGRSVISQAEVTGLANEVGLADQQEITTILRFYHELGDFVFYDEPELRDLVVLDPQWLIDCFRRVISINRFTDQPRFPNSARLWRLLEEKGLLHDSVLNHVWETRHKEQLVNLMIKFRLLLPVPFDYLAELEDSCSSTGCSKDNGCTLYVVPCLLPPMEDVPVLPGDYPPVLIVFQDDFLPIGTTSRLVTALVNEDTWTISGQIYQNYAAFLPGGHHSDVVVIVHQLPDMIQLSARMLTDGSQARSINGIFRPYLLTIIGRLQSVMSQTSPMAQFTVAVWCRCLPNDDEKKAVGLDRHQLLDGKEQLYCSKHWRSFSTMPYSPWFNLPTPVDHGGSLEESPSSPLLLEISEEISTEYWSLATRLGLSYHQIQQARLNHPHDTAGCIFTLLHLWRTQSRLDGPARVEELKKCLIACGRRELAERI